MNYTATTGCPGRDVFWGELKARSSRLANSNPLSSGLVVNVQISMTSAEYSGKVTLTDTLGTVVEREVTGPTCEDVSMALALIAAISLDAYVPETRVVEPKVRPTIANRESSISLDLGPVVGIHQAIAPRMVPTIGLAIGVSKPWQLGTAELRLEGVLGLGASQSVTESGNTLGDARFRWLSTRTLGCPLLFAVGPSNLGPCLVFELGALRGSGSSTAGKLSSTGIWLAPGAVLDGTFIADPIRLGVIGGLVRPLVRDTFIFSPRPTVFRPPSIGLIAEFDIAWNFN